MKKVIKGVTAIFVLLLSIYLVVIVKELNVLPLKYFSLFVGIMLVLNLIGHVTLFIKKRWVKIFTCLSYCFLVVVAFLGINYGLDTLDFLNKAFNNHAYEVTTYDVLVLKSKNIKEINDLNDGVLGYLSNDSNEEKLKSEIKVSVKYEEYEDIYELMDDLWGKKIEAALLNDAMYEDIKEEYPEKCEDILIIDSIDIEEEKEATNKDAKLEPMNIYLSGSDSRSKTIQNKSRSDVNMILTINPDTKVILMTSIPRDYYVQISGQTGLKDKLTHAGIYGIDRSRETVEDLFDIEIPYSIKVSMSSVTEVVDLVGGIDVVSDTEFNSYHYPGWRVKKGVNHMDGAHALAYSRERYAYASGDRHRILNQQQVLEAVLKKIVSDKSILTKYDKLLNSLSNLYRTDIPKSIITELVKRQIDDMSGWKFINNSVSGSDASMATYTAPKSKRYVMIPYEKDVKEAHDKIEGVLNGTTK